MDTLDATVPPGPPPDGASDGPDSGPRRRRWWPWLTPLGVLLVLAFIGSAFLDIPYVAIAPGEARSTEPLVAIEGADTFAAEGEVFFTTVRLRHLTLLQAFDGWLDDNVDVYERETILGEQTPEENRQLNQELMATSKQAAAAVALEELGYDVVHGSGATIIEAVPDSPASTGLKVGEVIVAVDGTPVEVTEDVALAVLERGVGRQLTLTIEPEGGGERRDATFTLAEHPGIAGQAFLGVVMRSRDFRLDYPFTVHIDTGDVGGPSAGLAFTLATLDVLTPGELTGGNKVATTGTIGLRGQIGPVGGVAQKTAAAKRAGAEVFLVPRAEFEEARRRAGADLRVEAVDTLDDALDVLASIGGNARSLDKPGEEGTERT
ncbi:MAG: YlbL family protein [Actinomycetota bacterium]